MKFSSRDDVHLTAVQERVEAPPMIPNRAQKSVATASDRVPHDADLVRGLTRSATTALVVGTVIGTGVFIKTAIMAQDTGSASTVLLAWVAAGVLSMCGALTYAELGAMLPHAGGEYVYLRHAYGELAAFLFGWMRFVVGGTGSIAMGWIIHRYGFRHAFGTAACLAAASLPYFFVVGRRAWSAAATSRAGLDGQSA